ncbi:MAG: hypothetical protein ABFD49_05375 [Armatimonadota bacterium]|nr:hypothetical protein [bacterium]
MLDISKRIKRLEEKANDGDHVLVVMISSDVAFDCDKQQYVDECKVSFDEMDCLLDTSKVFCKVGNLAELRRICSAKHVHLTTLPGGTKEELWSDYQDGKEGLETDEIDLPDIDIE